MLKFSQSHHYTDATTASYASRQPELESSYGTRHPPTIRISRQNQPEPASNGRQDGRQKAQNNFQAPIGSGFATIRPVTLMKKQQEEQVKVSAFREQMGNYKKLRQEHRRIMLQLECKFELIAVFLMLTSYEITFPRYKI